MRDHTRRHMRLFAPATVCALAIMLASALGAGAATSRHAANAPVYGGTFRVAYTEEFATFDPSQAVGADWYNMNGTLFEGLYRYDRNGHPQLDLADGPPTISADGKTWTFKIKKGILFSNGMEVTADDFKFSIVRSISPHTKPVPSWGQNVETVFQGAQAVISGKATDVAGIQVLDRYTIRFTLTQPTANFPYILGETFNMVVPKAVVTKIGDIAFGNNPVGTGPFMLQSWEKGVKAIFVKNPRYHIKGLPYVDKIICYTSVPSSVIALRVQKGELDGFALDFEAATADLQQMRGDPRYASYLVKAPSTITVWLDLNVGDPHDPLLKSLTLRKAIAMAIDRQKLVRLDGGNAIPANQMYIPLMSGHDPTLDVHAVYPNDPQKAAALVKASGYHGQQITLMYHSATPYQSAMAPGLQQDWQQVGLNVTLRGLAHEREIYAQLTGHQLNQLDWSIDYPDAYDIYAGVMSCAGNGANNGGLSGSHYCDPAADALVAKAQALTLGTDRDALFRQAQLRILQSATKVPLIFPRQSEIVSPKVGGFYYNAIYGWQYENYWLKP